MRQPGNTWTNIGFILCGLAILRSVRRDNRDHLRGLAWVAIVTGVGSAFFHASETFLGSLFDYGGMFVGASYMLAVNMRRWLLLSRSAIRAIFWASLAAPLLFLVLNGGYGRWIYFLEGVSCCGVIEGILYVRQRRVGPPVRYGWLMGYWSVFLVGFVFWWMDMTRRLCDPGNHWISGHGIWHLLDAVALYFVYLFYRQFEVLRFSERGPVPARG
ncbi:MAG: ceramidase domain-containing protein [Acidobacteriota bacterium]